MTSRRHWIFTNRGRFKPICRARQQRQGRRWMDLTGPKSGRMDAVEALGAVIGESS